MDFIAEKEMGHLVAACAVMTDQRQAECLGYAFTEDAELSLPYEGYYHSRDDIISAYRAFWSAWKSSHHLLGQCIITSISGERAEGIVYCLLTCTNNMNAKSQWGLVYRDGYRIIDGEWYIHRRRIEVLWER